MGVLFPSLLSLCLLHAVIMCTPSPGKELTKVLLISGSTISHPPMSRWARGCHTGTPGGFQGHKSMRTYPGPPSYTPYKSLASWGMQNPCQQQELLVICSLVWNLLLFCHSLFTPHFHSPSHSKMLFRQVMVMISKVFPKHVPSDRKRKSSSDILKMFFLYSFS